MDVNKGWWAVKRQADIEGAHSHNSLSYGIKNEVLGVEVYNLGCKESRSNIIFHAQMDLDLDFLEYDHIILFHVVQVNAQRSKGPSCILVIQTIYLTKKN